MIGFARSPRRTSMASARSLSQFQKAFSDEASCAAFMFERRWPDGFVCPACGKRRAAALKSRPRLHECLDCGRQTSVTAGTVMHRSKLPLTTWFWAAHLMTTHSNGMSALQLRDQLGVTYKTAWLLTQKLRRSMVDPNREPLEGVVEVDQAEIPFREGDAFFEPGNDLGGISVSEPLHHTHAKPDGETVPFVHRLKRAIPAGRVDANRPNLDTMVARVAN